MDEDNSLQLSKLSSEKKYINFVNSIFYYNELPQMFLSRSPIRHLLLSSLVWGEVKKNFFMTFKNIFVYSALTLLSEYHHHLMILGKKEKYFRGNFLLWCYQRQHLNHWEKMDVFAIIWQWNKFYRFNLNILKDFYGEKPFYIWLKISWCEKGMEA